MKGILNHLSNTKPVHLYYLKPLIKFEIHLLSVLTFKLYHWLLIPYTQQKDDRNDSKHESLLYLHIAYNYYYHNLTRPIPCVAKDALIPLTLKVRTIVANVRTST